MIGLRGEGQERLGAAALLIRSPTRARIPSAASLSILARAHLHHRDAPSPAPSYTRVAHSPPAVGTALRCAALLQARPGQASASTALRAWCCSLALARPHRVAALLSALLAVARAMTSTGTGSRQGPARAVCALVRLPRAPPEREQTLQPPEPPEPVRVPDPAQSRLRKSTKSQSHLATIIAAQPTVTLRFSRPLPLPPAARRPPLGTALQLNSAPNPHGLAPCRSQDPNS